MNEHINDLIADINKYSDTEYKQGYLDACNNILTNYNKINLQCLDDYRLEITIDTHDNLKDLCLACDVIDWKTDEYITTIRVDDFNQLENRLKARFER